jgi:hypothetical protein
MVLPACYFANVSDSELLTRARWLDPTESEFLVDGFAGFLRVANASPMA